MYIHCWRKYDAKVSPREFVKGGIRGVEVAMGMKKFVIIEIGRARSIVGSVLGIR